MALTPERTAEIDRLTETELMSELLLGPHQNPRYQGESYTYLASRLARIEAARMNRFERKRTGFETTIDRIKWIFLVVILVVIALAFGLPRLLHH